jgi:hypothetical protein
LSPGIHTGKLATLRDLQHRKRKVNACTRKAKKIKRKKIIDMKAKK